MEVKLKRSANSVNLQIFVLAPFLFIPGSLVQPPSFNVVQLNCYQGKSSIFQGSCFLRKYMHKHHCEAKMHLQQQHHVPKRSFIYRSCIRSSITEVYKPLAWGFPMPCSSSLKHPVVVYLEGGRAVSQLH